MTQATLPALLFSAALAASAQPAEKLSFEVAAIKPSPPRGGGMIRVGCNGGPGTPDPGMFTCENMSLWNLIPRAYGIPYYQVVAPSWMSPSEPMFHITAKVPPGTTKDQFNIMLQNLLADRFGLVVHHETRDQQKYDLLPAKGGPRFKEAAVSPAAKDNVSFSPMKADKDGYPTLAAGRPGMAMMNGKARLYQPEMTMESLAGQLSGQLGKPVTDATNLKGKFEISLYWASEQMRADPAAADADPGPTLIQAIQDQLGLRLDSKKGPVDFLVVDRAEKSPTDN